MCSNVNKVRSLIIIGWLQAILFRIWFSRKHWASICCCMNRYFAFCKWFVIGLPCMHIPSIHSRAHIIACHVRIECIDAPLRIVCMCINVQDYVYDSLFGWLAAWLVDRSFGNRYLVGLLVCLTICDCECIRVRVYRQFAGLLRIFNMQLVYVRTCTTVMFQSNSRANINSYAI